MSHPFLVVMVELIFQSQVQDRMAGPGAKAAVKQLKNPLEPLLMKLAREFTDDQDLSDRLQKLYKVSIISENK